MRGFAQENYKKDPLLGVEPEDEYEKPFKTVEDVTKIDRNAPRGLPKWWDEEVTKRM